MEIRYNHQYVMFKLAHCKPIYPMASEILTFIVFANKNAKKLLQIHYRNLEAPESEDGVIFKIVESLYA